MRYWARSIVLFIAAVSFAIYPVLRGFGSETGVTGAQHYASTTWVAAHVAAMVGFVALVVVLRIDATDQRRRTTELLGWISVALLLPYYGAEAYGLNALGRWVLDGGDPTSMSVADDFRFAPVPITIFAAGWILLAWVAIRMIRDHVGSIRLERVGVWMTAAGLLLFLPQFFAPGTVRIAHGVILAVGLAIWAVSGYAAPSDISADPPALNRSARRRANSAPAASDIS